MPTLHDALINFRNALGYKEQDEGVCALYSNMAINAFLVGDLKTFNQRCASIKKKMRKPAFLDLIKKFSTSTPALKKTFTPDELKELPELRDAMAFIESGELYLNPQFYSHVFAKSLSQTHPGEISEFAQSQQLAQRAGRVLAKSFIGVYTFEELIDYIKSLNCLAEKAQQDFALNLGSDDHDMALCYSHASKCWQLIDVNYPELLPLSTGSSNWEEQLASQIRDAFFKTTPILFHTDIWTTGLTAPSFRMSMNTFSDAIYNKVTEEALTDTLGASLVCLAASHGSLDALRFCVEVKNQKGNYLVDLNKTQEDGITPIYLAAQNGRVEVVKLLIDAKDIDGACRVDLNRTILAGATSASIAAQQGHVQVLKLLIDAKDKDGASRVDLNRTTLSGATSAFIAAQNGHVKVLKLLIDAKDKDGAFRVDLNKPNKNGLTPVYMAAQNGHAQALKLLIDAKDKDGAFRVDLNKTIHSGTTSAIIAAQNGHVEALKLLIDAKDKDGAFRVDLNKPNKIGSTPVYMAAKNGHVQALKLLIDAKDKDGACRVDLNKPNKNGSTPAYMAAKNGHVQALKLLIDAKDKYGACRVNLNQLHSNGETLIFTAAQNGHKDVVIELLKAGVNIHVPFKTSVMNIKSVLEGVKPEVFQKINETIKNKSDNDVMDIKPKDIAWILGHDEIVSLLEKQELLESMQKGSKAFEKSQVKAMDTSAEEGKSGGSPHQSGKRKFEGDENTGPGGFFKKRKTTHDTSDTLPMARSKDVSIVPAMG